MADSTRRILCTSCGKEVNEWDVRAYNTGRRTQHLCPECYDKAEKDIVSLISRSHFAWLREEK